MLKPDLPTRGTRCFKADDGVVVEANEAQRLALAVIGAALRQAKAGPGVVVVRVGRATGLAVLPGGGVRFEVSAGALKGLARAKLVGRQGTDLTAYGREAVDRWDDDVDAVRALVLRAPGGGGASVA